MPGTITAFCGDIDYTTYELKNSNKFIRMNFSPAITNNTGWILCSGGTANINVFPSLFNIIEYLYGKGSNSNEFMVPNYKGYFLRALALDSSIDKGFDEREKNPTTGSAGTSNGIGSIQQNMVQEHKHKYVNYSGLTPTFCQEKKVSNSENNNVLTGAEIFSSSDTQESGNETRPVNIYVNYLIYSGLPASINNL